jgi:hypothetical protein
MIASVPDPTVRPSAIEYLEMPVRITRDAIYFGDEQLPGCIAANGITLKPSDVNELTVTFLVGTVTADDPYVTATETVPEVEAADPVIQYSSRVSPT